MNSSKKKLTAIMMCVAAVALIAAFVFGFYGYEEPEIRTAEFPFSITYEYNGETVTIEDSFVCEFAYAQKYLSEHERMWMLYFKNGGEYLNILTTENEEIYLYPGFVAEYYMGDPLYEQEVEYITERGEKFNVPHGGYVNHITGEDTMDEAVLLEHGFRIVSYEYPQPIENTFSRAGTDFNNEAAFYVTIIVTVFMLIAVLLVRKDKAYKYTKIDILSTIINVLICVFVLPLMVGALMLWGIDGTGGTWFDTMLIFSLPSITIIGLGISIILRRKEKPLAGLLAQIPGPLMLGVYLLVDYLGMMF